MKKLVALLLTLSLCMALPYAFVQAEEQIVLTFSHWGSETDEAVYAKRAQAFMDLHPNIKIEIQYYPADYIQKMTAMVAGGTPPDVMVFAEDIHAFSSKGQLLALNDYLEKENVDLAARVGQTAVDIYSQNGMVYGLPDRAGAMVLFYNKDMFDAAGIEYPSPDWGWEEMLGAAKAMTGGEGDAETWGLGTEYWWCYWMNWIYQGGGRILDENGEIVINSPENIAALDYMKELTTVHDVWPTRTELASIGSGASSSTLFAQGRIGMMPNGLWGISSLADADFHWDMAEVWAGATAPFGSALTISSQCKHPDEAFQFINFMNSVEGQTMIAENAQDAPASLEVLSSATFLDAPWTSKEVDMEVFARSVPITYQPPINKYWSTWDTIWSDEFAAVFDGAADSATVLANVEARMKDAME